VVGQPSAEIVMGKGSGIDSVKMWLYNLEIETTEAEAMEILGAVKQFGLKTKRLMSEQEFESLANEVLAGIRK
jgi:isopropylmalate/homocitrate/citramalate synthase